MDNLRLISKHYQNESLSNKIIQALRDAGKDPDNLTREDIAPFEDFHIGGRETTRQLAEFGKLTSKEAVLDIGCGIGGPARTLASEFDCNVTGIDITEDYCLAAKMLTEKVGLSKQVSFKHGNALDLPFKDGSFDVVWLQHVTMNIEDKKSLFQEIKRVLKPTGRLVFHEIIKGDNLALTFPVFWASEQSISFLISDSQLKQLLGDCGFFEENWNDLSQSSIAWFTNMLEKMKKDGPPKLGLALIVPEDAPLKAANVLKNLKETKIKAIQAVYFR